MKRHDYYYANDYDYLVMKRHIIKNLVMKIQNLVVNHESRPFKSNPVIVYTKYLIVFLIGVWESAETRIYFCSRPSKIK